MSDCAAEAKGAELAGVTTEPKMLTIATAVAPAAIRALIFMMLIPFNVT
jgi:hypothetical protein